MKILKSINLSLIVLLLLTFNIYAENKAKPVSENKAFYTLNQNDKAISFMNNFYKWYKTQYKYLNRIQLINMSNNPSIPYSMNYDSTEKYLSILKSTGFFSDNYISYYRNYFKKIDATLKKTKQTDGPVTGLDYDFITNSQEPQSMLRNLNDLKLTVVKSNNLNIIIKAKWKYYDSITYQLFYLTEINGKYLIDKKEFRVGDKVLP